MKLIEGVRGKDRLLLRGNPIPIVSTPALELVSINYLSFEGAKPPGSGARPLKGSLRRRAPVHRIYGACAAGLSAKGFNSPGFRSEPN